MTYDQALAPARVREALRLLQSAVDIRRGQKSPMMIPVTWEEGETCLAALRYVASCKDIELED